ncbi:MAG: pyrroline-5-carboxylate reductase, partial [Symploca sp. SIO2G7]|nr:pyrroline-5-carboxylate reductase [Symploca sp. SIO2G7]
MTSKLSLIGGGVMGEALLSRLIARKLYHPDTILVSELQATRREFLAETYGVQVTSDNRAAATASEVLLLAIKPQVFETVAAELAEVGETNLEGGQLPVLVSILAGVPLSRLEAAFKYQPVIRAMPNTPATVGAGITAIALGKTAQLSHLALAREIFGAVGEVVEVPEYLLDAVTGLSGSGPAYVALMIESLADGGVAAGLPRAVASQLAVATVLGTAQLLQQS